MSKYEKGIDMEYDDKEIEMSLPMESLAKIETLTGIGMLKLMSQAETNDLTLTNAATIFRIALNNGLEKKDRISTKKAYQWIDENGVVELFKIITSLIRITFDVDLDGDEEPGK